MCLQRGRRFSKHIRSSKRSLPPKGRGNLVQLIYLEIQTLDLVQIIYLDNDDGDDDDDDDVRAS